jgi:F0F1-type ATP synthase assembly protein I
VLRTASGPPPFRYPVFRIAGWQVAASAIAAAIAGILSGWSGAWSAVLGGEVNVSAGLIFAALTRLGRTSSAAWTLSATIRAEAGKITAIVLQLWLVLVSFPQIVHGAFFAAFVATVLVSQAAILIRD